MIFRGINIKVLLFYSEIVNPGGAEKLLCKEAEYFVNKGINVKILTFKLDKKSIYGYDLDIEVINSKNIISKIINLKKKINKFKPDIMIAQTNKDASFFFLTRTKIPYITHIHGTFFWFENDMLKYSLLHKKIFNEVRNSLFGHMEFIKDRNKQKINFFKKIIIEIMAWLDYLSVRKSKEIVVLTNQVKWEVEKIYNKKSIVSRGCLDKDKFNYKINKDIKNQRFLGSLRNSEEFQRDIVNLYNLKNKIILLSIGRLDKRKRIDVIIKSIGILSKEYKNIILIIGGIGSEIENLKNLVKELNIENYVKFVGFIEEENLFDYYKACDIFLFPSWTTSGISVYEALLMQKKVIITNEADEPFLDDPHVFLAEPSVDSFVKEIKNAIKIKKKKKKNVSKIDLSDYTWDKYFDKIYEILIK